MMSHTFGAFIEHESTELKPISGPEKVVPRDTITYVSPSRQELDDLQWGQRLAGPSSVLEMSHQSHPPTPGELEQSSPPTPKRDQVVDAIVHSATNPARNKWRLLAAGIMYTMTGICDAATGAIIPHMEADYQIGYAMVSMLFVANAAGFILAAPINAALDRKLGRSRLCFLVTALLSTAYTLLLSGLPFPVVVIAFLISGFGQGIFLAMTNLWIISLLNGTTWLGIMHSTYGIGGIISPIIATTMISHGAKWSYFYAIPLVISLTSTILLSWAFKGFEQDAAIQLLTGLERIASRQAAALGQPTHLQTLKMALRQRTTILGATFILFYQGAEVAISGWVISFLINYRKGDPAKVGNVTSGFWGGITIGRLVLTPLCPKVGEKFAVAGLIVIAAGLQLLVWLVPSIVGIAVAESLVGLALGPVYPCATAVLSRLLPRRLQITAMSFVTSMGSSGGALIPLLTGLLAQRLGTVVLHPIVIVSCAIMMVTWFFLPRIAKRSE